MDEALQAKLTTLLEQYDEGIWWDEPIDVIAQIDQAYRNAGYIKPLAANRFNAVELENAQIINEATKRTSGLE